MTHFGHRQIKVVDGTTPNVNAYCVEDELCKDVVRFEKSMETPAEYVNQNPAIDSDSNLTRTYRVTTGASVAHLTSKVVIGARV
jgi:hypothetical protein